MLEFANVLLPGVMAAHSGLGYLRQRCIFNSLMNARRHFTIAGLLTLFLLCVSVQLSAQDFTQIIYDQARGFTKNYVNAIQRDDQGFIWLGTDRGILRFDGTNFIELPLPADQPGNVLKLKRYGDGLLVVFIETGVGFIDLKNNQYKPLSRVSTLDAILLPDGTLISYLANGRLSRLLNGRELASVALGSDLQGTLHYRWGTLLLENNLGKVLLVNPKTLEVTGEILEGSAPNRSQFQDMPDHILISGLSGIFRINKDFKVRPSGRLTPNEMAGLSVWAELPSGDGFFLSDEKQIGWKKSGVVKRFAIQSRRLPGLRVLFVYDSANALIGANGGLIHLNVAASPIRSFDGDQELVEPDFRVRRKIIQTGPDDYLMFGNPGIVRFRDGRFHKFSSDKPVSTYDAIRYQSDLFATSESFLMARVSADKGRLSEFMPSGITTEDNLYCLTMDSMNGKVIVGARGAVFRIGLDGRSSVRSNSIGTSAARVIVKVPGQRLWAVGTTDGLYLLDDNLRLQKRWRSAEGLLRGQTVSDLLFTDRKKLWLTHEKGAEMMDLTRSAVTDSIPSSLFDDSRVTAVLKDHDNRLWFSTYKGILGFDPKSRSLVRLGSRVNLINQEFNYKAAALLDDGRLIFGGLSGYDIVDAKAFVFNQSVPDGVFSGYSITGEDGGVAVRISNSMPSEISFDTESESLRLYLSTKSPLKSINNRYEFRFNNDPWKPAEGGAHIDIYKLRPGTYTLEVRGFDLFGTLINFPPVKIEAQIIFYKSMLFVWSAASTILLLSIVILMIIRWNRKRERAIKENISMDLHDEVGTILTKALMAQRSPSAVAGNRRVEEYLLEGLHSLRLFINTMNQSDLPLENLVVEIRENIAPGLKQAGISLEIMYDRQSKVSLPAGLYRDIKLCVFETVNNAVKHAYASRVVIFLDAGAGSLHLTVTDDGLLTDLMALENRGSGVGNLHKRTRRNNGDATFSLGTEGHGLSIKMRFGW